MEIHFENTQYLLCVVLMGSALASIVVIAYPANTNNVSAEEEMISLVSSNRHFLSYVSSGTAVSSVKVLIAWTVQFVWMYNENR